MSLWASPSRKSWPTGSRHTRTASSSKGDHPHHSTWPTKQAQRSSPRGWSKTTVAMDQLADCNCPPNAHKARKPILGRALHPRSNPKSGQSKSYNTSAGGWWRASTLCTSARCQGAVGRVGRVSLEAWLTAWLWPWCWPATLVSGCCAVVTPYEHMNGPYVYK